MNKVKVSVYDEEDVFLGEAVLPFTYDESGNVTGTQEASCLVFGIDVFVREGQNYVKHSAATIDEFIYPEQ